MHALLHFITLRTRLNFPRFTVMNKVSRKIAFKAFLFPENKSFHKTHLLSSKKVILFGEL